ncbi:MAG: protein kinase [Phycisphaerales bacterium]|nr:protein kinase [Phycisphaerales bacterium]
MSGTYQPGTRVSEFVLEAPIGLGSFGEVWSARHHMWENERVAIKLPTTPEYVRYLQREGGFAHGLRHPNIVRVIGVDPYAEIPYLVMELVNGPSLRRAITDAPTGLPIPVCITIARGVLSAMEAAHTANILHRDLKPSNVLLNLNGTPLAELEEDQVKVVDFGLGLGQPDMMRSIAQSMSLERDNKLVGTLAYLAPELRDGAVAWDARGDLYAIGVMLFEMLTGERPVGAELPSTVRAETPAALDEVFRRLYARQDRRYESAKAALDDLTQRTTRRAIPPPPPLPPEFTSQGGKRCPSCSAIANRDDQFCIKCGYQLTPQVRRCPSCQAFPSPRDRFCIFCGAQLSGVLT